MRRASIAYKTNAAPPLPRGFKTAARETWTTSASTCRHAKRKWQGGERVNASAALPDQAPALMTNAGATLSSFDA